MSILSGLMGHASEIDANQARKDYARLLARDEDIEAAFKLIRDVILFTNRRLIMIDKQGLTGQKVEYMSVPYRSILRFSVESSGSFDLDAELKIWISGSSTPIERTFNKKLDVYALQSILASYVGR